MFMFIKGRVEKGKKKEGGHMAGNEEKNDELRWNVTNCTGSSLGVVGIERISKKNVNIMELSQWGKGVSFGVKIGTGEWEPFSTQPAFQ